MKSKNRHEPSGVSWSMDSVDGLNELHQLQRQTQKTRVGMLEMKDNDNDTLRKVPHPSNEGLALQARVKGS